MTRYIEDLNENTAPVSGDYLLCYDASAGSTDKDRKVNVSKFAVLAVANTFTTTQTMAPTSTAVAAVAVTAPTSSATPIQTWNYNVTRRISAVQYQNYSEINFDTVDLGNGFPGPRIRIGGNNNATNAASGSIILDDRAGNPKSFWVDASGNLRTHSSSPTNFATDTSGVVVGSQSSSLDSKDVLGEFTDDDSALAAILATPLYDFVYKNRSFNGEKFTGIITDYAPIFGMDRDESHPAGKSLNDITGFGYTIAALKAVVRRLIEVERKLA